VPVVVVLLLCGLVAAVLVSLAAGAVHVPLGSLVEAMLGRRPLSLMEHTIVFEIRLPRVIAAAIVGAALSCAGLLFQGLFRNPMADPFVIGSSGGAMVGACVGILFFSQVAYLGFSATALLAFVGSVLTMMLVYGLARGVHGTNVVALLLAGFAISAMLANSTYFFEMIDPDPARGTAVLLNWQRGVIGTPQWSELVITGVLLGITVLAAFPLMRRLNTLALGDEYAEQLGVRVERTRVAIILAGSLLTAVAVALGGMIGFAGLIVPHGARMLLGPDHVKLLPVTVLAGSIFLIVADTLARTVFAPKEIPVGILMVFVGGPFFLHLLRKSKREYGL
jgi:iron complex transport system permease protein